MKKMIMLCFLLMASFASQAQDLIPFEGTNKKYGYKDAKGKIVVQPKYDDVGNFVDGRCAVNIGGKWLPDEELISGGKWGYIDQTGKEIIPLKYDDAKTFFEGGAGVALIGVKTPLKTFKYGLIDKSGKEIVPPKYDFGYPPNLGFASMEFNKKAALVDIKNGREVIAPSKYDKLIVDPLAEGLIIASAGEKYGLIDKSGKEIIPLVYDDMSYIAKGKFMVSKGGKWFYTDKTGIELQRQTKDGRYIYTDKTGKEVQ